VYLGVPDDGALEALKMARTSYKPAYPTVKAAIDVWRPDIEKALSNEKTVIRVRQFDPQHCAATRKRGYFDVAV
jgi:hypothetical protein